MIELIRTNANDPGFVELVERLDAYLTITDGDEHSFYDQYNGIETLTHVVVAYEGTKAVSCGAMKQFAKNIMEIKRMYTQPENRSTGLASQVLGELENWARELGFEKCILETGKRQHEAVAFYPRCGYQIISNFGQYKEVENSLCYEKKLL